MTLVPAEVFRTRRRRVDLRGEKIHFHSALERNWWRQLAVECPAMTQYLSETSRDGQTKKLCTSIQHESRVWKNCSRVRVKTVDKSYSENVRVIMVNKQTLLTTTIVPQRCIPFLLRPALDVHCSVVFIHCVYSFFFFYVLRPAFGIYVLSDRA